MKDPVQSSMPAENPSCNPLNNRWKLVLLGCIFLAALGIRLIHINTPFLEFQAQRQYFSAVIARGYYFQNAQNLPDWQKTIALAGLRSSLHAEPRIMETLVMFGYLLNGGEAYWIPRLYSIVFWLIGGFFLYGIARAYFSYPSAVISLCFYLFLPYGIFASRSFQPDSLMVMLMLGGWWGLVRYAQDESTKNLVFATVVTALAFLVKIQALLFIDGAFMMMWLMGGSFRRTSGWRKLVLYLAGAHLFAFIYYGWGFWGAGFLHSETNKLFQIPQYTHSAFWQGWFSMVSRSVGVVPVLLGLIGWRWVPRGALRHQLLGLWLGYLAYGLVFTYAIYTHTYYQLPFIPLVSLTLGQTIWRAICGIKQWPRPVRHLSTAGISVVLLIMVNLAVQPSSPLKKIIPSDIRAYIEQGCNALGANTKMVRNFNRSYEDWVTECETIGEQVNYSQHVLCASASYDMTLYHAWIRGVRWYASNPYRDKRKILSKSLPERFAITYDQHKPEYAIFIQSHPSNKKSEIELFLAEHYPLFAQGKIYKIYRIDSPPPNAQQSRPESP